MELLSNIVIEVNEKIYLRNPESSELGKRIIAGSIDLIDEIGFESFNFKKLGFAINSPEASIYRYFESKHKLLLYLIARYWNWMEYKLVFKLANIESPVDRLEKALSLLTEKVTMPDEVKLYRIVISEASKVFLTREVDIENQAGVFAGYKRLVGRVSDIVSEINPGYKYPHMLISTVIEGARHERFFAQHLPRLTDQVKGEDSISEFFREIVFNTIMPERRKQK